MAPSGSDVQPVSLSAHERQYINGLVDENHGNDKTWFVGCRIYHTLPLLRPSVILNALLLVDVIVICALWLTGGDSKHLIHSISNFSESSSLFDLSLLAFVKWVLVFIMMNISEQRQLAQLPIKQLTSGRLMVFGMLVCLAHLIYTIVKGSLVLHGYFESSEKMPSAFYAAVILAVVLSFIESALALAAYQYLIRLDRFATKHIVNKDGQELDKDGEPIRPKVDIPRLIKLAKPEAPMIITGCFCLVITSGTSIAAPFFFGKVVDAAQTSMESLNQTITTLFLIYLTYGIAGFFRAWLFELAGQRLVARIRTILFSAIIKQDIEFFDITRTGELTNRLSSDTQVIQNAITVNISMLLRNVILIIGSLTFMFVLNPSLTAILLAVVPIISLSAVYYGNFMKSLRKMFQDKLADAGTVAEEAISSIRTVRSFNGEKKATESYDGEVMASYRVAKKLALVTGLFSGWVSVAAFGAICLAMWYGGKLVFEKQLSVGILTSFLVYTVQIAASLAVITSLYGDFMQALGASDRMFDIIDKKPKIVVDNGCAIRPSKFAPDVEFDNVRFTYPSRKDYEVLKGVSLKIKPGQVVALVGPSGGGKSTIVSLIERFYDCNTGQIRISGIGVECLDPLWFRTKMSLVSQEPTLFACSIKDNIAYGTDASLEQIIEAAKKSNAHNFIEQFPEKYDTMVGERGVRLSGGQKQRIAIARSLITNPAILLLDEATSALDAESEQLVQEAIDRAMVGRTVLIIAHRLSTVRNADMVVVIDKGVVAEQGTHDELIDISGVYKRLVLKQLEAGNNSKSPDDNDIDNNDDDTSQF